MRTQEFNSKLISLLPLDEVPVHVHPFAALAHQLAATPWGGSPPRPLCQKICYQTAQKTALCAPASTQEVRNPKIGQPLGAQPTPRFRGMLDALLDAMFDPLPPFTFCCLQAIVDEDAGV